MGGKSGGKGFKRLGIHLPRKLHIWLKIQAATQEVTMAALVQKILWRYYAEVTGETEENPPSRSE